MCRKVAQATLTGTREIEIWGSGEQTRSFTYIDDCVFGTQAILASDEIAFPINLGSSEKVTINRLVDVVEAIAGDEVDVADYRTYFAGARYLEAFPDYYAFNRTEKSLEHYLAAKLLELGKRDVYIDVASEHSPAPDIYRRLFGVTAYRQDLTYPPGLAGDRIGGDAG